MPTSSQARLMQREDVDLHRLLRIPHSLTSTSTRTSTGPISSTQTSTPGETAGYMWRPSLSLPQIIRSSPNFYSHPSANRFSTPLSISGAGHNLCPRRLPALVSYPSKYQNGAFTRKSVHVFPDFSNNWPMDSENDPTPNAVDAAEKETNSAAPNPDPDQDPKPDPDQDPKPDPDLDPKPDPDHDQAPISAAGFVDKIPAIEASGGSDTYPIDLPTTSSHINEKRPGSSKGSTKERRRSSVTGVDKIIRKSSFSSTSRSDVARRSSRTMSAGSRKKSASSDKALSRGPSLDEPTSHEINLMDMALSDDETDKEDVPCDEKEPEEPKPGEKKPKMTIKSLYKQLLTIGMSANTYRGVTLNKDGETKNATEEEAMNALSAMASNMVNEGLPDADTEEEDDEEEDVELVMGSLLADVRNEGRMHFDEDFSSPADQTSTDRARRERGLAEFRKSLDLGVKADVQDFLSAKSGALKGFSLPTQKKGDEGLELSSRKTSAADKSFLDSVASGSAFQTGGKPVEQKCVKTPTQKKKKVVYKLPPVRLRRKLPPENPHLLCIRTPNVDLSHQQVKNMLEAQLGAIVNLQHDPEYLQNGDVQLSPRAMWIFKMEDTMESNYARICMGGLIGYDGEALRIRKRDDVYKEENKAFLLVKQIKDEQASRMKMKQQTAKKIVKKPSSEQAGCSPARRL